MRIQSLSFFKWITPLPRQHVAIILFIICFLSRLPYFIFTDSFIEGDSTGRSALSYSAYVAGDFSGTKFGNWLPGGHWLTYLEYMITNDYADFPRLFNLGLTSISVIFLYLILNTIAHQSKVALFASFLFILSPHISINSTSFLVEGYHLLFYLMSFYLLFITSPKPIIYIMSFFSLALLCIFRVEGIVLSFLLSSFYILQKGSSPLRAILALLGSLLGASLIEFISYKKYGTFFAFLHKSDESVRNFYNITGIDVFHRLRDVTMGFSIPFAVLILAIPYLAYIRKRNRQELLLILKFIIPIGFLTMVAIVKVLQGSLISHIRYFIPFMVVSYIATAYFINWIIENKRKIGIPLSIILIIHFFSSGMYSMLTCGQYVFHHRPGFIETANYAKEHNLSQILLDRDELWSQNAWMVYAQKSYPYFTCRITNMFWEGDKSSEESEVFQCLQTSQVVIIFKDGVIERQPKNLSFLKIHYEKVFSSNGYGVYLRKKN